MTIDISKIKPGDTVRIRAFYDGMKTAGIDPIEVTTTAYAGKFTGVLAAGWRLDSSHTVEVLEHTPAPPSWVTALVVRDREGDLWERSGQRWHLRRNGHSTAVIDQSYGPMTVVEPGGDA